MSAVISCSMKSGCGMKFINFLFYNTAETVCLQENLNIFEFIGKMPIFLEVNLYTLKIINSVSSKQF